MKTPGSQMGTGRWNVHRAKARFARLPATATAAAATVSTAAAFVAATATAAATISATAAGTGFTGFGGIYAKRAALVILVVEAFNGRVELGLIAEGHERKSLGLAGIAVGNDFDPFNGAVCGEEVGDVSFGCCVGQVAHINVHLFYFVTPIFLKRFLRSWRHGPNKKRANHFLIRSKGDTAPCLDI